MGEVYLGGHTENFQVSYHTSSLVPTRMPCQFRNFDCGVCGPFQETTEDSDSQHGLLFFRHIEEFIDSSPIANEAISRKRFVYQFSVHYTGVLCEVCGNSMYVYSSVCIAEFLSCIHSLYCRSIRGSPVSARPQKQGSMSRMD